MTHDSTTPTPTAETRRPDDVVHIAARESAPWKAGWTLCGLPERVYPWDRLPAAYQDRHCRACVRLDMAARPEMRE